MMNIFDTGIKNDFNYMLSTIGDNITINDKDTKTALITKGKNSDKLINYKNIQTNYPINTGDIIKYNNKLWIILSELNETKNTYKGTIRQLPHTMKIYIDSKLYETPCIIESSNNGVFEGRYIITGDGNMKLTVQDNNITNKIKEGMRIIKWGYAWKVIAKTAENKGLRYIYLEKDSTNSATDDIENEIADRWSHEVKHTYSIELDTSDIILNIGDTKQLNITVKDTTDSGTVVVENPTIIYTSNNTDIVTINEVGKITTINEGETTITVKFENIEKIINVKVNKAQQEIPKDYYKVETSDTNCPPKVDFGGFIEDYTINYYKDNIIQSNTFEFSVVSTTGATTNLAKIYSKTNNKCTIKTNNKSLDGQFILRCKDTSNGNEIDRTIDIRSGWDTEKYKIQSITINKDVTNVKVGENLQLNVNAKNQKYEYKEPNVFYVSDNESIATVNEVGKVTGVGEGTCNISVYTLADMAITDTIQINVVQNNVELTITGSDKIYLGRTGDYTSNIPVVWKIEDVDNTTSTIWATITENTDMTCTVKTTDKWIFGNDGRSKYFNLIAIDKNNSNNTTEKKIRITAY